MYQDYSVNKEPPKEAKKYTISPASEGIILGIFALLLTFITAYFIYSNSMSVLQLEIKDSLLRMVSSLANCMDGDVLETFTKPSDVSKPEYQQFVKLLQKARIGTKHCCYLYIHRMVDGKVYFIVDPISIDENGEPVFTDSASMEPSIPMTLYEDPDKELLKTLREGVATVNDVVHEDRWGKFYSAYAPIYNSKKEMVGSLGADLLITEMMNRCQPMEDATKRAFIVSVSLAILLGTFVWFTRRFTFMLNESRQSIYKNFLVAKQFADQSSYSLGKQFQKTSSILKYTAQKLGVLSKLDDINIIKNSLRLEQQTIEKFSDKLLTLGDLKFSKREKELDTFSISEIQNDLVNSLNAKYDKNKQIIFDIDKSIPDRLYGAARSFEEINGHIYEFCLNLFEESIYSKTILMDEESRDVILRQSFAVSTENLDEGRKKLVEACCRNLPSVNWGEQLELSESINIPIIQELIYVLGSELKADIKDGFFRLSFDFVLMKPEEIDESNEA